MTASRFSRRQRKPPISSKQNCDTFRFVSFETEPLRCPRLSLRLVALVLPLGEQRELVRCPIGPSGWHRRRVAFVRRKCFEHFVSIIRIRHEGVIVQLYAVRSICEISISRNNG